MKKKQFCFEGDLLQSTFDAQISVGNDMRLFSA